MKTLFAAILCCAAATAALGEVYLKGPKIGPRAKGSAVPTQAFRELFEAKSLMTEPVVCNGVRTEMQVSLLHRTLEELLAELRARYPELKFNFRRGGVLFSIRLGTRWRERVLLVGGADRVTVFAMRLPVAMPKLPAWPRALPALPADAEADEIIEFPKSGGVYGSFSGAGPGALSRMAADLAARGYAPGTKEAHSARGKGELFLNAAKQKIITLSIGQDGTGTVCCTPLDKKK